MLSLDKNILKLNYFNLHDLFNRCFNVNFGLGKGINIARSLSLYREGLLQMGLPHLVYNCKIDIYKLDISLTIFTLQLLEHADLISSRCTFIMKKNLIFTYNIPWPQMSLLTKWLMSVGHTGHSTAILPPSLKCG